MLTEQIIEKSCFATETGAAIHVPPNCTALLEWMGLKPAEFGGTLLQQVPSSHPFVFSHVGCALWDHPWSFPS